jgi:predicted lipoprotein with Yx(FWY)xxD motif
MWFKIEQTRTSIGQNYIVRCTSVAAGERVLEERPVKGASTAKKTAELLASAANMTATVYGKDADGEFVYGVCEVADGAN